MSIGLFIAIVLGVREMQGETQMRRLSDSQKAKTATAALIATIILLTPARVFAFQTEVPAANAQQSTPQAGPGRVRAQIPQREIPQRQIIVSLPDKRLALLEDGKVLKTYKIAVGADVSRSPEGDFTVINRIENPTYYAPGKVIGPGKDNPVGTRWMGLSKKGYGIHGTNMPSSIGKAASHGCIRMRQRDLEELFALVRVGDKVQLRNVQMTALLAPIQAPAEDAPTLAANGNVDAVVNATPAVVSADGSEQ
jgi:lipoprotein-anchoring transpeptidase ErfK/SrfK